MQFTSLLLYYTCEEFLFLLSGVCLSLRVDPYLSAIQPGTIQHCTIPSTPHVPEDMEFLHCLPC